MIAIGCDHGGYDIKETIKKYFDDNKIKYIDFGVDSLQSVDYPIYAKKVAEAVASGKCEKGILCCGTGIGVSIAANKIKGIRAAVVTDEFCAEMSRRHNDANIIAMGGRVITDEQAVRFTKIFLETPFDGDRHTRRVKMIGEIENGNL